jgi:O-antigen/teichoic acid export membrane protein
VSRFSAWLPNRERRQFWAGRIGQFGAWQLLSQALQLITGFLLVRWMSIEAYAKYGLALGFQNMLSQIVDLGFSSSILALVGTRIHDREIVGRHVRAARSFRNWMLLTIGPLSAIGFTWLAWSHHWPLGSSLLLFASILALLFFQGWTSPPPSARSINSLPAPWAKDYEWLC